MNSIKREFKKWYFPFLLILLINASGIRINYGGNHFRVIDLLLLWIAALYFIKYFLFKQKCFAIHNYIITLIIILFQIIFLTNSINKINTIIRIMVLIELVFFAQYINCFDLGRFDLYKIFEIMFQFNLIISIFQSLTGQLLLMKSINFYIGSFPIYRAGGLLADANAYAMLIMSLYIYIFLKSNLLRKKVYTVLVLFEILLIGSRASMLNFIIFVLLYIFIHNYKLFKKIFIITTLLGIIFLLNLSLLYKYFPGIFILLFRVGSYEYLMQHPMSFLSRRFEIWTELLEIYIKDYTYFEKFFGLGLGNTQVIHKILGKVVKPRGAHNTYIQFIMEMGIFGISVLFLFIIKLNLKIKNKIKDNIIFEYLFYSFNLWFIWGLTGEFFYQVIFWFQIGLLFSGWRYSEKNSCY